MNNTYLLKKWIPAILIIIPLGAVLLLKLDNGDYSVLVVIALSVFLMIYIRRRGANRIETALKQSTSKDLIRSLTEPLKHSKDKQLKAAFTAYNKALSHILYGEYDEANNEVEKENWETQIPMFQALHLNIKALLQYFHTKDYMEGLSLSRKAKALASVPGIYPGSKRSEMGLEAYVEVGQVLAGLDHDELIASLETKFEKLPILLKLIIAEGLYVAYQRKGREDKRESMKRFMVQHAPFTIFSINKR